MLKCFLISWTLRINGTVSYILPVVAAVATFALVRKGTIKGYLLLTKRLEHVTKQEGVDTDLQSDSKVN